MDLGLKCLTLFSGRSYLGRFILSNMVSGPIPSSQQCSLCRRWDFPCSSMRSSQRAPLEHIILRRDGSSSNDYYCGDKDDQWQRETGNAIPPERLQPSGASVSSGRQKRLGRIKKVGSRDAASAMWILCKRSRSRVVTLIYFLTLNARFAYFPRG